MKTIKFLTFAAVAATLLFQTPIARADDHGQQGGQDHRGAKATFTKWATDFLNEPGRIIDMAGVVGGVVGDGTFTGEVLLYNPGPTVSHFVAFYHFNGPKHSFTALVNVLQTGSGPGTKAVIVGVVTDGWLKGLAVEGEYTEISCEHDGITSPCYEGSLGIARDSND